MSEITVSVVGSSSINPTVGNGDTVNVTIAPTGERGPTGAQGPAGPANVLSVGTVTSSGTASATLTGTSPSQVLNLVLPKGDAGTPATNIELQASATHLQWRYVGDTSWTNLVALSAITGPTGSTGASGTPVELQATSTHIQWRYVGGTSWTNVIALSSLVGATGPQGPVGPAGPAINLGDETPQPLGVANAGTALNAARADHVHATLTSFPYANLTGTPSTFSPSAHQHAVSDVTGLQTALDGKQAAGSYVTLVNGTVPSSMLPSFVDDVREGASLSAFPATGDAGVIYVAVDTKKIYRWSGSAYIEISPSPGTTTDVPEGTNLYYTDARASAAAPVQSVAGRTGTITLTKSDVGLGSVDNTADAAKPVSTAMQTALDGKAATSHTHTLADLSQSSATTGQVPTWDGTAWTAATPSPGGVISVAGQTGTVTLAQLGSSGTASSTTFLRGDGAWATAGSTDAGDLVTGKLAAARLPFATTTAAGAVIVGSGLSVASGVLSVDAPFPAPSSVYYDDGVRVTSVVGATLYELQYTTDGGSTYTSVGTYAPLAGATQAYALSNSGGKKFRARAYNANNVAGEWGYESGITIPGGGGSANIVEAASASAFPATGASETLYIATDVSRIYRWSGSVYVEIGTSGGSGSGSDDPRWVYFTPPAPTSVTATAGNAQATVSWTAPASSLLPITDYVVQFQQSGGSWQPVSDSVSTATSATATGLTNGTAYQFRVAGVNAIGQGPWSTASSAVTPVSGDGYFSNVALLLHGDTNLNDSSSYSRTPETSAGVSASTNDFKYGSGAIRAMSKYDSGTGGWLVYENLPAIGTGDYAIECWMRLKDSAWNSGYGNILFDVWSRYTQIGPRLFVGFRSDGAMRIGSGSNLQDSAVNVVPYDAWCHVAVCRTSGTRSAYINGSRVLTQADSENHTGTDIAITTTLSGINQTVGDGKFYGYIDDFRVTVGSARGYGGETISVPVAAFPDS